MNFTQSVADRLKAETLIKTLTDAYFQDCAEPLCELRKTLADLMTMGNARAVQTLRHELVSAFKTTVCDDLEFSRVVDEDHMITLLQIAPFLSAEPALEAYVGQSSQLDQAIYENLQWCMIEDPSHSAMHLYGKIFGALNGEFSLGLLDSALQLPEMTSSISAARDLLNYMSAIPSPWPARMKQIFEDHLPVIESFINVEGHWFETLAIVPPLCEIGHEALAQTLFANINVSIRELDPTLLDIAHQYFGDEGLSSKLTEFLPIQRGKTGLNGDEVVGILTLVDRFPNLTFPKRQWKEIEKSGNMAILGPAIGRFLRSVAQQPVPYDELKNPDAVNNILATLIEGSTSPIAKKMLLQIIGKDAPKKIMVQFECLRDEILAIDLGL
jgi:hypothetical protein